MFLRKILKRSVTKYIRILAPNKIIEGDMVVAPSLSTGEVQHAASTDISHKWKYGIVPYSYATTSRFRMCKYE